VAAEGDTVAVSVMLVPVVVVVLEELRVVVVEVVEELTVMETVLDVLDAYVLDPP
jgi:hypothetical protein